MRNRLSLLLCIPALGGLALGQGADKKAAPSFSTAMTAGPGFVQNDFLSGFESGFRGKFASRAGRMWEGFLEQRLAAKDVVELMNGKAEKSDLRGYFGVSGNELKALVDLLEQTIDDKDRGFFFGILVVLMVQDFDVDPSSDFCRQVAGARTALKAEDFAKIKRGNLSRSTIEDAFGLDDKDDQRFMQDVLKQLTKSALLDHPMCESLGMGSGKFAPGEFPTFAEGMAGFGEFEDGTAGGFPFDPAMPPCPFMGSNAKPLFDRK